MACALAEGAVTRLRHEFKLVMSVEAAMALCARLQAEAPATRTEIVSVYFDGAGFPLTRRALAMPRDCLKVRLKEYAPDLGSAEPRVVVEVKRERDGLTKKLRTWVAREELGALYERGELWTRLPFSDTCGLTPVLAVSYLRDVYQLSESWRVTVDQRVSFHRVDPAAALGPRPLRATGLDAPVSCADGVVVEVKHLDEALPRWLGALRAEATVAFSKFATGMRQLGMTAAGLAASGG
ncbi:MAG: VTC domain-containing protein [Myxococcaceae bacterium]|nr:VTC domain-containing protein [Myxococcaceae bacterium]